MRFVSSIHKWSRFFSTLPDAHRIIRFSASSKLHAGLRRPFFAGIMRGAALVFATSGAHAEMQSTAFFYGKPVPVEALMHYDRVVVEAESLESVRAFAGSATVVFAYVSVGEAEGWRASTRDLDPKLFLGANSSWNSRIPDLTKQGWVQFLIEKRMLPLWQQGYRGFFLDTLDSYQMLDTDVDGKERQRRALVNIIRAIHARFPGVQLLLNRGFDVLPEVGNLVVGVVAESLFQGWNPNTGQYVRVQDADRAWLLDKLKAVVSRYHLPVTVIDYVPAHDRELALDTSRRIRELGFGAWVGVPSLNTLAVENKR